VHQRGRVERELAAANSPTRLYQAQALLRADQPYAAQVVVPVTASARPTSPSPLLILALAAVVGAILGIFAVFLRDAWRAGGG
jgi:uncharacterized protein involved in exopolysaccharide biosynthesis